MRERAQEVLNRIREIKSQNLVDLKDNDELCNLERELAKIQDECYHIYNVILLFNRHRRFCVMCDKEDYTYRHD